MKFRIIFLLFIMTPVYADILVPFQAANKVNAQVTVDVVKNPNTHLYTYTYTLLNNVESEQSINNFTFQIDETTPVVEVIAPTGWSYGRYVHKNLYEFSSTEGITEEHVYTLPNGGIEIRSPYNIQPGESKCCFVFKTFSPPKDGTVYIQGYVPPPQSTGDEPDQDVDYAALGIASSSIEDNSFKVVTTVPNTPLYDGNRRPAVDGFVAPINFNSANQDEFYAPMAVYITFGINNETVFTETFKAVLNGVDITDKFTNDGASTTTKIVNLSLGGGSALQIGSNVLLLSVEGVVPGTTDRHAVDTDRIAFKVLQ